MIFDHENETDGEFKNKFKKFSLDNIIKLTKVNTDSG